MKLFIVLIGLFVACNCKSQEYFFRKYVTGSINGKILDVFDDSLNNRIYVGGDFTNFAGLNIKGIVCLDRTTLTVINTFTPNISKSTGTVSVNSITVKNNSVYFSGNFDNINGTTRNYIAAVNSSNGSLEIWNPLVNGQVNSIICTPNDIIIAGAFTTVNSILRPDIAAINPLTGILNLAFNANTNNVGSIFKLEFKNNSIYSLATSVIIYNGISRNRIAKLNANNGQINSSWNLSNSYVNDFCILNSYLHAVGQFTNSLSIPVKVCKIDTTSGFCTYPAVNKYNNFPNPSSCGFSTTLFPINDLKKCAVFEDISVYSAPTDNYAGEPLGIYATTHFYSTYVYNNYSNTTPGCSLGSDFRLENIGYKISDGFLSSTICSPFIHERFTFMKSSKDLLFVYNSTGYGFECYFPLPHLPASISGNSVVCAGKNNVTYTIPKYKYTKKYIWNYSGTGVSIIVNDTSAMLNFATNATSGILNVHCIGSTARANPCEGYTSFLFSDSVSLPITVNPIPSVNAGPDITLNCANNKVGILNGTVTTIGVLNGWYNPSNVYFDNNLSTTLINKPQGKYVLSSTITATGCSWRDTAYVAVDTLKPNLLMPVVTNTRLSCSNPSINLNASSSTPGVIYNWTNSNGYTSSNPALISTNSPTIPISVMAYSLNLLNPLNGCSNTGSVTLLLDTVHPKYGLGVSTIGAKISCAATTATITGISGEPKAKLYWNGTGLPINSPNPVAVNLPTTYTLMAKDTVNGCEAFFNYVVLADTAKPIINPLPFLKYLTCDTTLVTLNATSPSISTTFTWTPPTGSDLPNPSFVSMVGTYTLNATDVFNGCTRSRNLLVIVDTLKPNITTNVDSVKLTCSLLSYSLNAISTATPITINWIGGGGYTSSNPATITNQGFYTTEIKNTFNGCSNNKIIKVSIDSTKPYIVPFTSSLTVNCSYTTAVLSGTTIPSSKYVLSWDGISTLGMSNPSIASTPGAYTFTALDTVTGCKSIRILNLNYQPNLALNLSNDTTICFGSSANLQVNPIGGTSSFNYIWSNGATTNSITVSPFDTTKYVVTIIDNAGCIGKDSTIVFVPNPLQDSSKTFLPCDPSSPFGQIQIYPYGGIPPYLFAIGSSTYQSSNVFPNLILSTYTINIKDNLGCQSTSTVTIDNSSLRPEPNFLITTKMFKSDTFVVVDISNPRPDSVQWIFPSTCTVIDKSNPFSPIITHSDTGTFAINLKAFFGTCEMNKLKTIHVGAIDSAFANSFNNNGIESILLYPNPNNGQFNVEIKLYKKQTFALFIYDANGIEKYRQTINDNNYFNQLININPVTPGTFIIKVIAEYDAKQKPFIISN